MEFTLKASNGEEYKCQLNGSSYNCPTFKEYGYATERQLLNAINRKIRKQASA